MFCICIQFKHFFLGEAIDDENNGALSLGLSSYEDETTAFSSVASVGMCNAAFYQFENRDIHEFSASHQLDNNKDIRDLLSSSCCSNNGGIHPSTYSVFQKESCKRSISNKSYYQKNASRIREIQGNTFFYDNFLPTY